MTLSDLFSFFPLGIRCIKKKSLFYNDIFIRSKNYGYFIKKNNYISYYLHRHSKCRSFITTTNNNNSDVRGE